ncbi:MAG: serine/threonine-protein phosphatase [Candidatus Eremiobacteraeota bacterium]|nr:serine/threonine-protein phosphatase [Candidatus Eremiobacteraeota bacterium]
MLKEIEFEGSDGPDLRSLLKMFFGVVLGGMAAFLLLMVARSGSWSTLLVSGEPRREGEDDEPEESEAGPAEPAASEESSQASDDTIELFGFDWLEGYATTHQGLVRSENQDRFLLDVGREGVLALVADGMGGHSGGSVASSVAVKTIGGMLGKLESYEPKAVHRAMHDSFERADEAIRHRASKELKLQGMGTTAVGAVITKDFVVHAYTGDSRLYHFRDGELIYRTQDHSVVRYLQEEGLVSEEEARTHPMRSRLTSSLGGSPPERKVLVEPAWKKKSKSQPAVLDFRPGDVLLLCSDGLNGEVEPGVLERIVAEGDSLKTCVQALLNEALEAGGRDNVTILALRRK